MFVIWSKYYMSLSHNPLFYMDAITYPCPNPDDDLANLCYRQVSNIRRTLVGN